MCKSREGMGCLGVGSSEGGSGGYTCALVAHVIKLTFHSTVHRDIQEERYYTPVTALVTCSANVGEAWKN